MYHLLQANPPKTIPRNERSNLTTQQISVNASDCWDQTTDSLKRRVLSVESALP